MQSSGRRRRRRRVLNRWTIGLRPSMSLPTANQLAVVIRSRPSSSCAVIHPLHGGMQTMCVCRLGQYIQPSIRYVYVDMWASFIPLLSTPHQLHHQQFHVQLDIFSCQNILKLALSSSSSIRPLMVMCIILLSLFWSICIPSRDRMGPGPPSPLLKLAIIIIISNISEKTRERTFRQKYTLNGGEGQRTGSAPSSSAAEDDCIQFGSRDGWMPNCDSHVNRNV